jgi:hypothetical protein
MHMCLPNLWHRRIGQMFDPSSELVLCICKINFNVFLKESWKLLCGNSSHSFSGCAVQHIAVVGESHVQRFRFRRGGMLLVL